MAKTLPTPDVLGDVLTYTATKKTMVNIGAIRVDGGTQMRAGLDDSTVFDYTQIMIAAQGWGEFPVVIAYHDGQDYWLADGFHRVAAFKDAFPDANKTIPVDVRAGTRRDAILHAAGANAEHGLRRTNADKRRAVEVLLRDEEWAAWSDHEIARQCTVSQNFVSSVRRELTKIGFQSPTTRRGADGRTIDTTNIGTSRPAPKNTTEKPPTVDVPIKLAPSSNNVLYVTSPEEPVTVDSDSEMAEGDVDEVPVSLRAGYDGDEWYTPEDITRTAHHVMGSIDLDPATCELAQTSVQAGTYYTKVDDGLAQTWAGNVWLNPPYSAPQVWIDKLFAEMAGGRVSQAIVLVNNATETAWFQRLLTESKLVCFPARRLAFWRHDHSDVAGRQGQALFYFGNRAEQFYSAFSATGAVLRRLK